MPTSAFYSLSDERKKSIIDAAKKEFSNNLLEDASINKIIKDINMPRGTFYLYFENKEDLYEYILTSYRKKFSDKFLNILKENDGDIFKTFSKMYDFILNKRNNDIEKLMTNIFINMNSKRIENNIPRKECKHDEDIIIVKNINTSKFNDKDEIYTLLSILFPLFFQNLAHSLMHAECKNKIKDNYNKQLNIIKRGMEGD